jgi:hypothetical protein
LPVGHTPTVKYNREWKVVPQFKEFPRGQPGGRRGVREDFRDHDAVARWLCACRYDEEAACQEKSIFHPASYPLPGVPEKGESTFIWQKKLSGLFLKSMQITMKHTKRTKKHSAAVEG